jgi:hypothetical protein
VAEDEGIEVVLTVGELDAAVVALREFLHKASAIQVQAVVDRGEEPPVLVSCGRLEPIEVTYLEEERVVHMPHATPLDAEPPTDLPEVPPLPPLEVDAEAGTVTGPLGGVEAAARAVEALARHLGGRSVALAIYPTTDPDVPLGISARAGEGVILSIGEQQFGLPE